MPKFDIDYQAYRRERLHRYANMDPDMLVEELGVETLELMDALFYKIEKTIEQDYDEENEEPNEEEEPPF
jgi:hypothetical protein